MARCHRLPLLGVVDNDMVGDGVVPHHMTGDVVRDDVAPDDVARDDVVPHDVVPHDVVPHDVVPDDVVRDDAVPHDVVPYDLAPTLGVTYDSVPRRDACLCVLRAGPG